MKDDEILARLPFALIPIFAFDRVVHYSVELRNLGVSQILRVRVRVGVRVRVRVRLRVGGR